MGWVYFIREGAAGPIKIGTALDPYARLRAMQTGNSSDLVLLGATEGDAELERRLHDRFSTARIRGEWFTATAELLAFIEGATLSKQPTDERQSWPFTPEQVEWLHGFMSIALPHDVIHSTYPTAENVARLSEAWAEIDRKLELSTTRASGSYVTGAQAAKWQVSLETNRGVFARRVARLTEQNAAAAQDVVMQSTEIH